MVDAPDSKSGEGNLVRVRVSPALPTINKIMKNIKNLTAVFSLFATGITIVTNGTNRKQFFGCTVNSFSSLSLVPPKFLFCLGNENLNLKSFKLNSPLNVNFLAKSQLNLSNKFAGSLEKRWVNTKYKIANNKVPFFPESLGLLEAKVEKKVKSGDHTIIICLITNCIKFNTKKPLIYYKSKYHTV